MYQTWFYIMTSFQRNFHVYFHFLLQRSISASYNTDTMFFLKKGFNCLIKECGFWPSLYTCFHRMWCKTNFSDEIFIIEIKSHQISYLKSKEKIHKKKKFLKKSSNIISQKQGDNTVILTQGLVCRYVMRQSIFVHLSVLIVNTFNSFWKVQNL